jgi:hypothetical protein
VNETGLCIFCHQPPPHGGGLTEEHIIPEALRGRFSIENGSCRECARITNEDVENIVLRDFFAEARAAFNLQTKKKRKSGPREPKSIFLDVKRGAVRERLKLGAKEMFAIHHTPFLFGPRLVLHMPMNYGSIPFMAGVTPHNEIEQRVEELGITGFSHRVNQDFNLFARMLAKIAHCWAATIGFDKIEPILEDYILGRDGANLGAEMWVGNLIPQPDLVNPPEPCLHVIRPSIITPWTPPPRFFEVSFTGYGPQRYLVITVSLFNFIGFPHYDVVVGRLRPGVEPQSVMFAMQHYLSVETRPGKTR